MSKICINLLQPSTFIFFNLKISPTYNINITDSSRYYKYSNLSFGVTKEIYEDCVVIYKRTRNILNYLFW